MKFATIQETAISIDAHWKSGLVLHTTAVWLGCTDQTAYVLRNAIADDQRQADDGDANHEYPQTEE